MSIPPNSQWRGCAAYFPPTLDDEVRRANERAAQFLLETVYYFNTHVVRPRLDDIVYRNSSGEHDILHHVFRWDERHYDQVFQHGFEARREEHTPEDVYYDLYHYVRHSGRPLDSSRGTTHAFVGTTLNSGWHPGLTGGTRERLVYRYEIYAPGGIWVNQTLGREYPYQAQDEVCFVAGIAPQYIRSVQQFRLIDAGNGRTIRERVDDIIRINGNYDPEPGRILDIRRPVFDRRENGRSVPLTIRICRLRGVLERHRREAVSSKDSDAVDYDAAGVSTTNSDATNWYAGDVANFVTYIDAAFRSSSTNEAYLFMKNEYVLVNYAPGTTDDRVVNGPLLICDGYPSLEGTAFGEYGIDCAFGSWSGDEAFIFSGNLCAHINYAPGTKNDKIIKGPMTITAMFPFFKDTVFESGVDAAFENWAYDEAYVFKGNQYALINYGSNSPHLIAIRELTQGFPSLKDTVFESGIDAAFASHRKKEAYLFKGDSYALIYFAPGTTDDYLLGGVKQILPNWPSLRSILPRQNRGLDVHYHARPAPDRDHDEL